MFPFFKPSPTKKDARTEITKIINQQLAEILNTQLAETRKELLSKGIKPEEVEDMLEKIKIRSSARLAVVAKKEIDNELNLIMQKRQQSAAGSGSAASVSNNR